MGFMGFGSRQNRDPEPSEEAVLAQTVNAERAVIWFQPDGTILKANANFCALMGYATEDLPGKHHSMFCRKDFAQSRAYKEMWERLGRGETIAETFPRVTRSGETVWINGVYAPVRNSDGKIVKVVKFANDVTAARRAADIAEGKIAAISRAQAVIEFALDGTVETANDHFLAATGYRLDEIAGKHHSMFLFPEDRESSAYGDFWPSLARGEFKSGEFRRRRKDGQPLFLSATYNPILDAEGRPLKVVKFARDVTGQWLRSADMEGQIAALSKTNAVIEFDMDGTIRSANENFLTTMGYSADEVVGRKHAMFMPEAERNGSAYAEFWARLRAGTYQSGEFCRIGKGGREVWIQGSYNPIAGADGKPYKVVKFAVDISDRKQAVREVAQALTRLSEGDLTARIDCALAGEFDRLRIDFNATAAQLCELVSQVQESSHEVTGDVAAITQSAGELSRRTERQAANLEETAAAMEQLSASVDNAAGAARDARDRASQSNTLAQRGGEIVKDTVTAMADIAKSSEQVSRIISVIDEIAFQTNLLALNAGVEAARAGDTGRGFAVVASEVRALAQRSSDAAREIAQLIETSGNQVKKGVDLVGSTGKSLEDICSSVDEVLQQVSQIARLSEEQRGAIREINSAVSDIDRATQQNAAMFEEVTAATQSLSGSAKSLSDLTSAFAIERGGARGDSSWGAPARRGAA